jgi:hypothetical protein
MSRSASATLLAAAELRRAADLVELHAPQDFENDVVEIKRRIGWILAGLDDLLACGRCGRAFRFDAVRYARERMIAPRTCPSCRNAHRRRF